MKNRLTDLNDHLFAQMERLGDEDMTTEKIAAEAERAEAMVKVADKIIENWNIALRAGDLIAKHGDRFRKDLPMLGGPTTIEGGK